MKKSSDKSSDKNDKSSDINLFTFLSQIQSKRKIVQYDKKIASAYMLSIWLSHDKALIKKVNEINKFQFLLPDEVIYNYYMNVVPSGKRYIKWIKKRKKDEMFEKRIKKIKEYYPNLSTRECKMIITYLVNRRLKNETL